MQKKSSIISQPKPTSFETDLELLTHRNDWQKNAYDRLKDNLSYAKDNPLLLFDNSQAEHLVIVYGNPQVGKTTLILTLIGISDESFSVVENVLRAGRLSGNSSTSTAIIYSKSEDDHYRCYTNMDPDEKNIKLNENEVECKLKSIREKVENRILNRDTILYIKIPQYYFNDSNAKNISIMDMPGVDSCNKNEGTHVKRLFDKYIPICSVCIIAARGNEIQGVSNIKLVNNIDWKKINDKFVLVLTHCYGDAKIKTYFKENKRDSTFYEYVRQAYGDTLKTVLGSDNQTELFPVDLGKSLHQLCNEVKNDSDKNEILYTQKMILAELCHSIKRRSGNRFISAINELERYVDSISSAKIKSLRISDKEDARCKIIDRISELSQIYKNENALSDTFESETYMTLKMIYEREINGLYDAKLQLLSYISSYPKIDIEKLICNNGLSKKKIKLAIYEKKDIYLNDPEKRLINYIRKQTYEYVADLVNTAEIIQFSDNCILGIDIDKIDLLSKIETQAISVFEDWIYPQAQIGVNNHVYLPSIK